VIFSSCIAANARIEGLSRWELEPYLERQPRQVGIERPYFEGALELLASASQGFIFF
jgi:hypothetical protein